MQRRAIGRRRQDRHHHRRAVGRRDASGPIGLDRTRRSAMRILPVGADHGRGRPAQAKTEADRRRHQPRDDQHLSLRHLSAHPGGHSPRGRAAGLRGGPTMTAKVEMTPKVDMSRRDFLASTAAVGGAMVLGFHLPPEGAQAAPIQGQPWYRDALVPEINAWLTIAPDDTVTNRVAQTEMGTGVFTSCPMMVAEELQCDWSKVRAEYASPQRDVVEKAPTWTLKVPGGGDPRLRDGGGEPVSATNFTGVYRRFDTNSSGSVRESRYYLQMAGAEARERLLLAAAEMWKVPRSELTAKDSVITHAPSGRRTTYGAIAAKAAHVALPDPSKIKIKGPDQFTLIGTEQKNR